MKLFLVDSTSLDTLKQNLSTLLPKFQCDNCDWIESAIGRPPFVETKFAEIPAFTLDMSEDEPFRTDGRNAETVYKSLKFLSDSQASDERFWAALCLREYWPYVRYRWKLESGEFTKENILQHVFFGYGARRSLTRNALSRLWWAGRLTYDPNVQDPYRLTRFACENADTVMHALERNTSNSRTINKEVLSAILDGRDNEGLLMNTDIIGELAKHLNLLGGTYILDCLPEGEIYTKILEKAREIDMRERKAKDERAQQKEEGKANAISGRKKRQPKPENPNAESFRSFVSRVSKKRRGR